MKTSKKYNLKFVKSTSSAWKYRCEPTVNNNQFVNGIPLRLTNNQYHALAITIDCFDVHDTRFALDKIENFKNGTSEHIDDPYELDLSSEQHDDTERVLIVPPNSITYLDGDFSMPINDFKSLLIEWRDFMNS